MPPQASGAKFQRANTYQQREGGYDTYGAPEKSDDEEEDYQRYMDAQKRDDPWKRSGTQREHSIGSDFDNDGNVKEEQPKEAEQTDFFGMGEKKEEKPAAGGFDFDFGLSAPQNNSKPV